jgi:hypothetical protein
VSVGIVGAAVRHFDPAHEFGFIKRCVYIDPAFLVGLPVRMVPEDESPRPGPAYRAD